MASSAIARQTQQTQLSHALKPESSRKMALQLKLAATCLDRGEAMDDIRLDSYSSALMAEFPDDVDTVAVLDRLANSIRAEFEPIIPPKAELIVMIRREDWARRRKAREEREAAEEKALRERVEAERKEAALAGPREKSAIEKRLDEILTANIDKIESDRQRLAEYQATKERT